jgi:hypothetical protein
MPTKWKLSSPLRIFIFIASSNEAEALFEMK